MATPVHKRFYNLIAGCDDDVQYHSLADKQRRSAFIYACFVMFACDIILWFLGMRTIGIPLYETIHPVHFAMTFLLIVLYLRGKMSVKCGVILLCAANQTAILYEMWLYTVTDGSSSAVMIPCYMALSGLNITLALLAYIRILPLVLVALALVGYGACCIVSGNRTLVGMLPIFFACFSLVAMLGRRLSLNVQRLEREKTVLKDNEQKVLNLFDMDRSQLMAYVSLAKEKGLSTEQAGVLLDVIGEQARENIRHNVSHYYRQREINYTELKSRLPGLTPSEIEICDLVLKEKKLKEIVRILGKSEGNITSQRANIRRKLGLDSSENLHDALVEMAKTDR